MYAFNIHILETSQNAWNLFKLPTYKDFDLIHKKTKVEVDCSFWVY